MTRHIDFEGIENFRDFGGYETRFGRPMKRGVLYRSANHAYATDADLARMADLGLAAIIDLRRKFEREREPSKRWPGFGAAVIENDILAHHVAGDHPDDIMADYLLTNDEARIRRKMDFLRGWLRDVAKQEVGDDALRVAVGVNPAYLDAAFEVIKDAHGSTDNYLRDALGVDAGLRERLHARLLA